MNNFSNNKSKTRISSFLTLSLFKIGEMSKLFCLFICLTISMTFTNQLYAQEVKLSVNLTNVSVSEALNVIEQKADIHFFYNNSLIDMNRKVTVNAENKDIFTVLDMIFKDTNVRYKLVDKDIILTVSKDNAYRGNGIMITGTVTDSKGEALPGVSVSIKGTQVGVITDANGNYSIVAPNTEAVLAFSYVGFITQEFRVGNQTVANIMLKEDSRQLDEVVVVGYGTQKRSDVTGSVISIKPDIYKDMNMGVAEVLQGRVAGVYVTNGQIIIRGAASINGSDPLWIVDGVPGGPPDFEDIETIEVLKDGASIAIYGATGAGGVILVTTKHGKAGKTQINVKGNWGGDMPLYIPKMLNTPDYIDRQLATGHPTYTGWNNPSSLPNTNWNNLLWGNAFKQNYLIQISGGSENNTFNITGDYHDNRTIAILNNSGDVGGNLRAAMIQRLNKRIKFTEVIGGGYGTNIPTVYSLDYRQIPVMSVYDSNNESGGGWGKVTSYFQGGNPVASALTRHYDNKGYGANAQFVFDYNILDGLNFQANFSGSFSASANNYFQEAFDVGANGGIDYFEKNYSAGNNGRMFYTLTYDHTFAQKHYFKAMAGYEASRGTSSSAYARRDQFPVPLPANISLGIGQQYANGDVENSRGLSQFVRLNYAYDNKYMLEGSLRRDGYDNFGPDNRFATFPSVSAGWNIHKESFIANNAPYISQLKLRTSYGVIGNNTIGQYLYDATFTDKNMYYQYSDDSGISRGFMFGQYPNSGIKCERVAQYDLGLDAGFLNNRLNFSAEYYSKRTSDMLYWINLPLSSGVATGGGNSSAPTWPANIGEISNKGFDFMIQYRGDRSDFHYDVALTMSTNNNKVIKLSEEINPTIWQGGSWIFGADQPYLTENGQPMGQLYGYVVEGIFKTQAEIDALNAKAPKDEDGNQYYQNANTATGDFKYKDVNGDGRITDQDKTFIGNPWPKIIYGLNINLSWKNFELNMGWSGNYKFDIFNSEKAYARSFYSDWNSTYKIYDAWTIDNPNSVNPRVTLNDPNGNYSNISSYFIEDGSYLKLKTLFLGYNLPASLLEKVRIQEMKVFVNCNNLLTISKFDGDPEIGGAYLSRNTNSEGRFPSTRTIMGGISLTF